MFFHFGIAGFLGGFTGVDVLFVISGFLMTQIILRNFEKKTFRYILENIYRIPIVWIIFGQNIGMDNFESNDYFQSVNRQQIEPVEATSKKVEEVLPFMYKGTFLFELI